MVTHWETSNRPLFIRTVWKDGQHHFLLRTNSEEGKSGRESRRSTASSSSARSKHVQRVEKLVNFHIPAVKIFYNGSRKNATSAYMPKLKEKPVILPKPDRITTVDIIPSDSVRIKNMNQEVAFTVQTTKILSKSKSFDLHSDMNIEGVATQPATMCDQFQTTLNEKVMIWLDLATQKSDDNDMVEKKCNRTVRKRSKTAALQRNHRTFDIVKSNQQNVPNYKYDYAQMTNDTVVEETNHNFINIMPAFINQEVTPQIQNDQKNEITEETTKSAAILNGKRQLHIFLPKLPKKCSETDSLSFLSSKASSLLKV